MGLSMTAEEFLCSLFTPGISLHSIMLFLTFSSYFFLFWGGGRGEKHCVFLQRY